MLFSRLKYSLKFVPKFWINNIPVLVQIMAWRQPGDKPLSEPMMVSLLTHICVTPPQWVNDTIWHLGPWSKQISCHCQTFWSTLVHASENVIWKKKIKPQYVNDNNLHDIYPGSGACWFHWSWPWHLCFHVTRCFLIATVKVSMI